eukprot:3542900-Rhodomonas_salina.2
MDLCALTLQRPAFLYRSTNTACSTPAATAIPYPAMQCFGTDPARFCYQTMAVNSVLRTINLASSDIGPAGALALWHYV